MWLGVEEKPRIVAGTPPHMPQISYCSSYNGMTSYQRHNRQARNAKLGLMMRLIGD